MSSSASRPLRSGARATHAGDSTVREEPADPTLARSDSARLYVLASPDLSQVGSCWPLSTARTLLIGRGIEQGGVALEDARVSRTHARIAWDGRCACFRIGDLNSENGTFVNGQRQTVANLQHGTVLRTGNTVSLLMTHDPVEELDARSAKAAVSDACVLLLGESGTGKELLARRLHQESGRSGAFVAVNTAALPRELVSTELFGHSRGAFSGAHSEHLGLFRSANGGTLFLDEIGDFPLELQPTLLRVLEDRRVRPVGAERDLPVDVRVIAATHQDLQARVQAGTFRLDLHARLAELELKVPALRERRHSLPALIASLAASQGLPAVRVTADAMELLALHSFPQNIRELRNLVGRLKTFGSPPFDLDLQFLAREAPALLIERRREETTLTEPNLASSGPTRGELVNALSLHRGKVADVAKELKTSRTQVYRWLKRFGLAAPTLRNR